MPPTSRPARRRLIITRDRQIQHLRLDLVDPILDCLRRLTELGHRRFGAMIIHPPAARRVSPAARREAAVRPSGGRRVDHLGQHAESLDHNLAEPLDGVRRRLGRHVRPGDQPRHRADLRGALGASSLGGWNPLFPPPVDLPHRLDDESEPRGAAAAAGHAASGLAIERALRGLSRRGLARRPSCAASPRRGSASAGTRPAPISSAGSRRRTTRLADLL